MKLSTLHRKVLRRFTAPSAFTSASMEVGGRRFVTPIVDGAMCECAEPWIVDLIKLMMPHRPGVFFDVGVNLGQTLVVAKAVSPNCSYIGVEANPLCVAYSERLVALNNLTDCQIIAVGLANETGFRRLQLYYGATVDSSASLVDGFRPEQPISNVKLVPVFPFEAIERAADIKNLGIVKIDVEGGEADVISSMCDALARHRPWMIVEILPCYNVHNADRIRRQDEIQNMLCTLDYAILRIIKSAAGRLQRLEKIDEIGIHGELALSDYVFCPKGDADAIIRSAA